MLTPLKCPQVLAGHDSWCWRSAMGAGVPYNREKIEKYIFLLAVPANKMLFAGTVQANNLYEYGLKYMRK